jgi:hypothetical protein
MRYGEEMEEELSGDGRKIEWRWKRDGVEME